MLPVAHHSRSVTRALAAWRGGVAAVLGVCLFAGVLGALSGCAHTMVVDTVPTGAEVILDAEAPARAPVVTERRPGVGQKMAVTVIAEGYETRTVIVEQTDWFLWPAVVALTPALGFAFLAIPIVGIFPMAAWMIATSPTLVALAFVRKYPDRVVVTLRPRMLDGVPVPADGWQVPSGYDPNPPPTSSAPPLPPPKKRKPQPDGANPVPLPP